MDFLKDLNPQQLEAVTYTQGPLLVLAGAGSGKTRVITYRIAHLIEQQGVYPDQILAVTFTNKAAEEMRNRVLEILGESAKKVWISTFHSACVRILRQEIHLLGYGKNFVILDTTDQLRAIKECVRELNINGELYDPKEIARRVSGLKNRLVFPQAYIHEAQGFGIENKVAKVYSHYQNTLKQCNSLDFDDLLMLTVYLFETRPEVLHRYQEKFRHMMIDEYQDTNHAQYRLMRLLGQRGNICVVGDDDQSIYGFRGADLRNILHFEKDYPHARVIRLEQNYRSTQNILDASGAVVKKNRKRRLKQLWTQNSKGTPIQVCHVTDEEEEARYIGKTIKQMIGEKWGYPDVAILYRTHAQSRTLEEGLRNEGIPYRIVGGLRFYERKEIKDVLAYLKVIAHPEDDLSLKRILNVPPRGIGTSTVERLEIYAKAKGLSFSQALTGFTSGGSDESDLTQAQRRSLSHLAVLLEELRHLARGVPMIELLKIILKKTGYEQRLHQEAVEGEEGRSRLENIQELFSAVRVFEERFDSQRSTGEAESYFENSVLTVFLDHVALVTDSHQETEGPAGGKGAVSMMTFHSAKGLEFPAVFMAGMEDGLFPHQSALTDPDEMEEERRLCYVGMTRTKEMLCLLHAEKRRLYGSVQWNAVSRFIEEIPVALVKEVVWSDRTAKFVKDPPASKMGSSRIVDRPQIEGSGPFRKGIQVKHPVWGIGQVRESEGQGEDQRVVVHFSSVGSKKLAVKFARLEKVGGL
jgi:DNA helicase-2/ATP-dependent DNA helicase PcrA